MIYSSKGSSILAVFLRAIGTEHEFLTMNGTLTHHKITKVLLSISPFVDPELLTPLLNQLPETMSGEEEVDTWAPTESSAPLLQAMLKFDRASKDFYQQHASRMDNLHDILALEKEYRYMTTRQIAAHIAGESEISKVKPSELLAVHRSLMKSPVGFNISSKYHRHTHNFEIVPKQTTEIYNKALLWLRDLQEATMNQVYAQQPRIIPFSIKNNPIGPFLTKVRPIIKASRLRRPVTKMGRIGPDISTYKGIEESGEAMRIDTKAEFTADEECLVKFLRFWAVEHHIRGPYSATLNALGSRLVRATGCYHNFDLEISQATGYMFLQEIGAILPWENREGYGHRLRCKEFFPGLKVDRMWRKTRDTLRDWEFERPRDVMRELRKDWGSLEVFSIDPLTATIIDDGLSVVNAPNEPGKYWLHTHVANPTAFVQPYDPIAKYAAEVGSTLHLPERTYHMIHAEISKKYFSVGSNKPVLTFSAKVDLDGNLYGTNVSSGIVHNCIRMDANSLQEALEPGSTANEPFVEYTVGTFPGHRSEPVQAHQNISEDHLTKLRLIQKLASARASRRPNWDVTRYRDKPASVLATFPHSTTSEFVHQESPLRSTQTYGDPQIVVRSARFNPQASILRLMVFDKIVDDAMILACEVAALWCKQRNIPNIYRGTIRNSEVITPEQFKEKIVKPAIERTGKPPFLLIQDYARISSRNVLSSYPIKHEGLGIEAYLRVTSPLRRYTELVAHWQIEAALRYEHRTGKPLVGCENPDSFLPFSREMIEAMFMRMNETEVVGSFAATRTTLSWIMMYFFRAHYFGQGNLPPILKVFLRRTRTSNSMIGTLELVNIDVRVRESELSKAEGGLQMGDWWECKIVEVDTYQCKMTMEPVKLVERMGKELCLDLAKLVEVRH